MNILHLALGGCLKAPPVAFGITADTGGHIAYILAAAQRQADLDPSGAVSIVTRAFADDRLDPIHGRRVEAIGANLSIVRIATTSDRYLEKEALAAEIPSFVDGFCRYLAVLPRLPDVIHAHFADAAEVASEAQRRFGIPFVYTPHALGIDKRAQRLGGADLDRRIDSERRAIAGAAKIIVSTRDEAERQVGAYGVAMADRVRVIAPGAPDLPTVTDGATIAGRLDAAFERPDLPIILAVARPVAKKNLAALIRVYAGDAGLQAGANLVIVAGQHAHASGEERAVLDELRDLAAPMTGRVALPPRHDMADVAALYARAARGGVFVNPALHEPFGLTLLEAAAAGVPVVATCHGGPAEIVPTIGHGLLVDPRDDAAIAAAIRAVILHPARRATLVEGARTGIRHYCWRRYAARSRDVYREATVPRLLASDIDNTLTGCADGAAQFADWRARSTLPFVIATGRGFDTARMILRRWRLPQPDAFIVDVGTRLMLPDGAGGWRECPDYAAALDRDWDRDAVAAALAPLGIEPQAPATAGPHKISFFGTADDAARIRAVLEEAGLRACVVFSHGRLIDVLAPTGGKAQAIAAYAARHGWTLAQCVAAGDSGNDADMLAACGHAIVVGNASAELDGLPPRPGLHRTAAHHAAGVVEGLAALGLVEAGGPAAAVAA